MCCHKSNKTGNALSPCQHKTMVVVHNDSSDICKSSIATNYTPHGYHRYKCLILWHNFNLTEFCVFYSIFDRNSFTVQI